MALAPGTRIGPYHPHSAAIYDLEETEGALALALELVEGEVGYATQLVEGLEAAHEKGMMRDGRFIMLRRGANGGKLRTVVNWTDELKQTLAAGGGR